MRPWQPEYHFEWYIHCGQRNHSIWMHRKMGDTFPEIAKRFGISAKRVSQIYGQCERAEKRRITALVSNCVKNPMRRRIDALPLTARAENACAMLGLKTVRDVDDTSDEVFLSLENVSKKTLAILRGAVEYVRKDK